MKNINKQGIVLQGPTMYCREVAPQYSECSPVVWATWIDEPKENIDYLKTTNIEVILIDKPSNPGYLNINMQTVSTIAAIEYITKKYKVDELLKTRGDVIINKVPKLLEILKGNSAAFLATCREGARSELYYELVYPHYSHDYPDNFFFYGTVENVHGAFNFFLEDWAPIPPESLITYHLMQTMGIKFNLDFEYMKENGIYFYYRDCIENNITLYLPKRNEDIMKTYSNEKLYVW